MQMSRFTVPATSPHSRYEIAEAIASYFSREFPDYGAFWLSS
jgi:hypothetical protein